MSFIFPLLSVIERLMNSDIPTWRRRWPAAQWTGRQRRSRCSWVGSGSSCRAADKDLRTGAEGWRSSLRTRSGSATRREKTSMSCVKTTVSHAGETLYDTHLQGQKCTKIPRWYISHWIHQLVSALLWHPDVYTWFSLLIWSIIDLIYRQHLYNLETSRFNQSDFLSN